MDKILNTATNLKNELLNSDIYKNYITTKDSLKNSPEINKRVEEFRTLQIKARSNEILNEPIPLDKEGYLSKLYSDLMLNKLAADFFEAEHLFLVLYNKILDTLCEDIDVDFF